MLAPLVFMACFGQAGAMVVETHRVPDLIVGFKPEQIIKLITAGIGEDEWQSRGGRGSIEYYPLTNTLMIQQKAVHQKKIREILDGLRKARRKP